MSLMGPVAIEIERESEYPVAAEIWWTLKSYGYNDYVCAGILGNIMVEAGGQTLTIQPTIQTSKYYGICQWSKKYYPSIWGASLEEQCEYLHNTMEQQFKVFGKLYKKGFTFADFLNLTDEQDAALAFAKCYERCASEGYQRRQNCATKAYEFFVDLVASSWE